MCVNHVLLSETVDKEHTYHCPYYIWRASMCLMYLGAELCHKRVWFIT